MITFRIHPVKDVFGKDKPGYIPQYKRGDTAWHSYKEHEQERVFPYPQVAKQFLEKRACYSPVAFRGFF